MIFHPAARGQPGMPREASRKKQTICPHPDGQSLWSFGFASGGIDAARVWKLAIVAALLGSLTVPWLAFRQFSPSLTGLFPERPSTIYACLLRFAEAVCIPGKTLCCTFWQQICKSLAILVT